jgi:hypothetical protein
MKQLLVGVLASGLACDVLAHASGADARQTVSPDRSTRPPFVERFLASTDPALASYRAFRTLEAETRGGQMRARLTAWTSLDPVQGFQYSVVDETGSSIVRQKVLRAALEGERLLRANGEIERGALTPSNYEFSTGSEAEENLIRIGIHPKRHDTMLIEGSILLTDPDGDLARIEGSLIKRPSIWTREVHVVRRYERINGIRVPVSMQSTARVVIVGRSTFSMVYEYASINGVPVMK